MALKNIMTVAAYICLFHQAAASCGAWPINLTASGSARLVPTGQARLRSMLVEAAWVLKAKEPWAAAFYNQVLHNSGKAQKAIVALARKLAKILWCVWLENRPYQTNYSFK